MLERFGHFFVLGAEHLLFGIDHILFLLALIVGSRRLRDVVFAATSFTVAHSVTFILAALGVVSAPAAIVEPIIALSIAVVAAWYLWRIWRVAACARRPTRQAQLGRADWAQTRSRVRLRIDARTRIRRCARHRRAVLAAPPRVAARLQRRHRGGADRHHRRRLPATCAPAAARTEVGIGVGIVIAAGVAVTGMMWFVQRILGVTPG